MSNVPEDILDENRAVLKQHSNDKISKVRLVVHRYMTKSHWSFYAILKDSTYVVKVNMTLHDEMGELGVLSWESYNNPTPRNYGINSWDFEIVKDMTLGMLADLIIRNDRQNSDFKGLNGCRPWCFAVFTDLEKESYLKSESGKAARGAMGFFYTTSKAAVTQANPKGLTTDEIPWVDGVFHKDRK